MEQWQIPRKVGYGRPNHHNIAMTNCSQESGCCPLLSQEVTVNHPDAPWKPALLTRTQSFFLFFLFSGC
jgi:hypothetical protein